jgi:hypothetical protein
MNLSKYVNVTFKEGKIPFMRFVQIYDSEGKPHFHAESDDTGEINHSDVLESLLSKIGIPAEKIMGPFGRQIVKMLGEDYKLVGAGLVRKDLESGNFIPWGRSETYDLGIDYNHLEKLANYLPEEIKFEVGK